MNTKVLVKELLESKLTEVADKIGNSKSVTLALAKELSGDVEGGSLYDTLEKILGQAKRLDYVAERIGESVACTLDTAIETADHYNISVIAAVEHMAKNYINILKRLIDKAPNLDAMIDVVARAHSSGKQELSEYVYETHMANHLEGLCLIMKKLHFFTVEGGK